MSVTCEVKFNIVTTSQEVFILCFVLPHLQSGKMTNFMKNVHI